MISLVSEGGSKAPVANRCPQSIYIYGAPTGAPLNSNKSLYFIAKRSGAPSAHPIPKKLPERIYIYGAPTGVPSPSFACVIAPACNTANQGLYQQCLRVRLRM